MFCSDMPIKEFILNSNLLCGTLADHNNGLFWNIHKRTVTYSC